MIQLDRFKQWQRVKPIGLLYFADKFVRGLFGNFFVLIPMFIGLRSGFERNPQLGSALLLGFIVLFIGFIIASYYAFQFRISDGRIEIRKGILKRLRLNVPYDKVQDIKLEQPFYYRSSKTTVVLLDTAGSSKQEATLVALPADDAELLKQIIQSSSEGIATQGLNDERVSDKEDSLLITRNLSDLVIHGITNNRVWIILGALSPFIDDAISQLDSWLHFLNLSDYYSIEQQGLLLFSTVIFSTLVLFIALVTGFSILGAIFTFYGYELHQSKDRLRRQSGLLTRYQVNVKISRIQHIVYKQDWLDSLFGRINLAFKQMNAQKQGSDLHQRTLIVPSISHAQGFDLGLKAFQHKNPFDVKFNPISKRFILRNTYTLTLPITVFIIGMLTFAIYDGAPLTMLWWLVLPVILELLIILRWYRWGYFFDTEYLYIQKGLFGVDKSVFPLYKTQQSAFVQSVLLKRLEIANIELSFASALAKVPFMPEHEATTLIDKSLFAAESSTQSWM